MITLTRFRRSRIRSSARATLTVIVVGSFAALIMPRSWSNRLTSLVQVVVPLQDVVSAAGRAIGSPVRGGEDAVARETFETLRRQKQAIEHRAAALAFRVQALQREVGILTATRLSNSGGRKIGARGRLIPARVISGDLLSWRSSRLISAGSLQGVPAGAAVASREFSVDQGEAAGLHRGMAILLGEAFVGLIEQTGTHTSRVKLLSDVSVELKVRIGRFTDVGFDVVDRYFWLTGRGGGRMEIRDVQARDVTDGVVQVGDVVVSDPMSELLPAALTIGRIGLISPDRDNPLFAILSVDAAVSDESLTRVYVYDPRSESAD